MASLATRAEILKLERLCQTRAGCFAFLEDIPAVELRRLRGAIQDSLFSGSDAGLFKRLAAASALLPLPLVAMMAQKIFGPVLGARIAGEMSTTKAVALSARLPVNFLADVSIALDPARARDILHAMPPERIRDVARELLTRGECVTMGRFVGYLTPEAIALTLEAFDDAGDLLRVAFFVENRTSLSEIVELLSEERVTQVLLAAQNDPDGLWPQAMAFMADVDQPLKRKLGDLAASQSDEVLQGLAEAAHREHLWGELMPVVACMSAHARQRVCALPQLCDEIFMGDILQAVDANNLWQALLPLVDDMPEQQLASMAVAAATHLPDEALGRALKAANNGEKWDAILRLSREMDDAQLEKIGHAVEFLPENAIPGLLLMADERDLWDAFLPIAAGLSDRLRGQVASLAAMATPEMRDRIVEAARNSKRDLWPALLGIVALIEPEQRGAYAQTVAERARAEPGLVAVVAPHAEAAGLQDLLAVARKAVEPSQRG